MRTTSGLKRTTCLVQDPQKHGTTQRKVENWNSLTVTLKGDKWGFWIGNRKEEVYEKGTSRRWMAKGTYESHICLCRPGLRSTSISTNDSFHINTKDLNFFFSKNFTRIKRTIVFIEYGSLLFVRFS